MSTETLDAVFSALADPTRRSILQRLGSGDATVSELAEPFDISLPAISRHLKVLEAAGLITRDRHAQWRTSSLRVTPLEDAGNWIDTMRSVWEKRFDRLDAHLHSLQHPSQPSPATVNPEPSPSPNRKDDQHA